MSLWIFQNALVWYIHKGEMWSALKDCENICTFFCCFAFVDFEMSAMKCVSFSSRKFCNVICARICIAAAKVRVNNTFLGREWDTDFICSPDKVSDNGTQSKNKMFDKYKIIMIMSMPVRMLCGLRNLWGRDFPPRNLSQCSFQRKYDMIWRAPSEIRQFYCRQTFVLLTLHLTGKCVSKLPHSNFPLIHFFHLLYYLFSFI